MRLHKIKAIIFFFLTLITGLVYGHSTPCQLDPAIGSIDGECITTTKELNRDGAVILYLPGTEGVADFATMRLMSPNDNVVWFLSTLLGAEHLGVSATTSALPRLRSCEAQAHTAIRNWKTYQRYCMPTEAVTNFTLEDAQNQAERALDQARRLAQESRRPLVIMAFSHGCNHVAKLVRDGKLHDESLVMINCSSESMALMMALQSSNWTHWAMLQKYGLGSSLRELRELRLHPGEWQEYVPDALIDNAVRYCRYIDVAESECDQKRVGQSIYIETILMLMMADQAYGEVLSPDDYEKLGELLGEYRVGNNELRHFIYGDKQQLRYHFSVYTWAGPRYKHDMLQQDAAYKSLVRYQGPIRYPTSDRDVLVPQRSPYCSNEASDCRDTTLLACPHDLPSKPGYCATQLLREIRHAIATAVVANRKPVLGTLKIEPATQVPQAQQLQQAIH
jgi:hypothetical protein